MTQPRLTPDIPVSDEQAKLGREILGAGRDFSSYLAGILGETPKNLVGLLVGDYLEIKRLERKAILLADSTRRLKERGIENPEPNVNLALPILAAAADETREELQNIWEGLLTAAMDPQRQNFVRQVLITTVKAMDPLDALVFNIIAKIIAKKGAAAWTEPGRNYIASQLGVSFDEVTVSFDNLANLNLVTFGPVRASIQTWWAIC